MCCYRSEAFFDLNGAPAGHVFALSENAETDVPEDRDFLGFVTRRVGAEFNRRRTEQALQESEARLSKAAKMAKVGYWVWDEIEDKASYCSDEMAEICGVDTGRELTAMLTSFEKDLERRAPASAARRSSRHRASAARVPVRRARAISWDRFRGPGRRRRPSHHAPGRRRASRGRRWRP